jgi:hypothetical protein
MDEFNELFNEYLLPSQLKYGARLIGRWMTQAKEIDSTEVFALWEYDTYEIYEEIEKNIKNDKEHVERIQRKFDEIGRDKLKTVLKEDIKQEFIKSTVPREKTILKDNFAR